jgi:hypothetical protein
MTSFSLRALARAEPALAAHYLWDTNPAVPLASPAFLHLGCGERVLDGLVNLDFIPHDARVHAWNLLDVWPQPWSAVADGMFCEDVLEHFFRSEQAYVLCNVNRALRDGGVARVLMPNLDRLIRYGSDFAPAAGDVMHDRFGVDRGGDAINMGMRFSGHRWLHNQPTLAHLAQACGFDAAPTSCARSTVPRFDDLNLRDEADSLSFANDLRKRRRVDRAILALDAIERAREIEEVADGIRLFEATAPRPVIRYTLPRPVPAGHLACLNVRSANLSSFHEHNLKQLWLNDARPDNPWHFDETMKSRPCMNLVTQGDLRAIGPGVAAIASFAFSPAARVGERFVQGCAELFTIA